MKTRCPSCGAGYSLDVLIANDAARDAVAAAFALSGDVGKALLRYLTLHRPVERDLTLERVARLINDLLPDIRAQRIERDGKVFDAPPEAWAWAIDQAMISRDAGRLKTPLRGHGWLYEVLTRWKPASLTTPLAGDGWGDRSAAAARSKTMQAVAALEALKR